MAQPLYTVDMERPFYGYTYDQVRCWPEPVVLGFFVRVGIPHDILMQLDVNGTSLLCASKLEDILKRGIDAQAIPRKWGSVLEHLMKKAQELNPYRSATSNDSSTKNQAIVFDPRSSTNGILLQTTAYSQTPEPILKSEEDKPESPSNSPSKLIQMNANELRSQMVSRGIHIKILQMTDGWTGEEFLKQCQEPNRKAFLMRIYGATNKKTLKKILDMISELK